MSKITFRADEELVERMEGLDTSKSEAMRDALRLYLDGAERSTESKSETRGDGAPSDAESAVDDALRARVDELVRERVDAVLTERLATGQMSAPGRAQDVNVNISVDGAAAETPANASESSSRGEVAERKTPGADPSPAAGAHEKSCEKCGEGLDADDVYCANCGEKATHRVFCECGDEVRSDWAFCPGCGRRTSAADVLDRS
ncbi:zinc ribbon domain-containing protein [Halogeometricum sp. S1BR25-6]|uniref:Zinc ribbon domain-containing protein n=1 Tax=Halogeometricum salsisoli TaxID=2950536 RepID=A0ABU2GCJ4_9EURY|nr:zinc ribbon domain-containing protein [Halogeometricum sp. S1BR25-6]MDS0297848.1 zinc ribbon domain-containing protein [Halogeometricum sp. S1BR25-6]